MIDPASPRKGSGVVFLFELNLVLSADVGPLAILIHDQAT